MRYEGSRSGGLEEGSLRRGGGIKRSVYEQETPFSFFFFREKRKAAQSTQSTVDGTFKETSRKGKIGTSPEHPPTHSSSAPASFSPVSDALFFPLCCISDAILKSDWLVLHFRSRESTGKTEYIYTPKKGTLLTSLPSVAAPVAVCSRGRERAPRPRPQR